MGYGERISDSALLIYFLFWYRIRECRALELYHRKETILATMVGAHQKRKTRSVRKPLLVCILALTMALAITCETRTNWWEAVTFSWYAKDVTWWLQRGRSSHVLFPPDGPFDLSRGYAHLPEFQQELRKGGYTISVQARQSPKALALGRNGIAIPYNKERYAGLRIYDEHGEKVYVGNLLPNQFPSFQSIPPLLVKILLYRENRELLDAERPFLNPGVEWDRFVSATFNYFKKRFWGSSEQRGGSTLATQIIKFRHSLKGRTGGPLDKIKQMVGASVWAYHKGTNTVAVRREIVREYLNGMPLGAAPGYGEINGIGNGMRTWYGRALGEVIADLQLDEAGQDSLHRKAITLKQALSLIIATQSPLLYLKRSPSYLEEKVTTFLGLLETDGIISSPLREAAVKIPLQFREGAFHASPGSFVDRKGTNAIRTKLLDMLNIKTLYELDRLDLSVYTTLDSETQREVTNILNSLSDRDFLRKHGFLETHLLQEGDPQRVIYGFTLFESSAGGDLLRVQSDTLNKPFSITTGTKLELGSTAKLRTLASYLMAIERLDNQLVAASRQPISKTNAPRLDPLSQWLSEYRLHHPEASREEILNASLQRVLSASPHQTFFTGGGIHKFSNYKEEQDDQSFTIEEGFIYSVNLVFIRLMKELVAYHVAKLGYDVNRLLSQKGHPDRMPLLEEAAEDEAIQFLKKYYRLHAGKPHDESFRILCESPKHPSRNWVMLFLKENPETRYEDLLAAARSHFQGSELNRASLRELFGAYKGKSYQLTDEAYLLVKHPLEVWVVFYLKNHPEAGWNEVLEASHEARRLSSSWIFKPRFRHAQNLRIRTLLERKAFAEIHRTWKDLGYPFEALIPSLATAIGSSADRPLSLAELIGIILSDGIYRKKISIKALHFAQATPYETRFVLPPAPDKPVMSPEVAQVLRDVLERVVERGTARRVKDLSEGHTIPLLQIGGKTGTGDNRFTVFRRGGEVMSSKITSRTSTFVFYAGRFFGIVTAYVEGSEASHYTFTSALAAQVLKTLWPSLKPLLQASLPAKAIVNIKPKLTDQLSSLPR